MSCRSYREHAFCMICPPREMGSVSVFSVCAECGAIIRGRTQRLSRRVFLSLRAACNPRGLLATMKAFSSIDDGQGI